MNADELEERFRECLAQEAVDAAAPRPAELWGAFLAFARMPVSDVARPLTEDDTIGFVIEPCEADDDELSEAEQGTRLVGARTVQRPHDSVFFGVIAVYEPSLHLDFWVSRPIDGDDAVEAFQRTVEADSAFAAVRGFGPARSLEIGLARYPEEKPAARAPRSAGGTILRTSGLDAEYSRLLAELVPSGDTPDVLAIWRAFVALARLPVEDVMEPNSEDDTAEIWAGTSEGETQPHLTLSRYVVRPDGTSFDMWVIADLDSLPLTKRLSVLAIAGGDAAAEAFADRVEQDPAFTVLVAAKVLRLRHGDDEID